MTDSSMQPRATLGNVQIVFAQLSATVDALNAANPDSLDSVVPALWSESDAFTALMFTVDTASETHPTESAVYEARDDITTQRDAIGAAIDDLVAHPNNSWDTLARHTKHFHELTNGPGGVTDRRPRGGDA